jgi:hypothetical protein
VGYTETRWTTTATAEDSIRFEVRGLRWLRSRDSEIRPSSPSKTVSLLNGDVPCPKPSSGQDFHGLMCVETSSVQRARGPFDES